MAEREFKSGFSVSRETVDGIEVLNLSGDLDASSEARLRHVLDPMCEDPTMRILLDCHDVNYMNSATLGLFGRVDRTCKAGGGKLVICRVHAPVYKVMELLGLTQLLTVVATREEGLAALSAP